MIKGNERSPRIWTACSPLTARVTSIPFLLQYPSQEFARYTVIINNQNLYTLLDH